MFDIIVWICPVLEAGRNDYFFSKILGGVEEIDETRLDALGLQLGEAEQQLTAANLEPRLRALITSRQTQQVNARTMLQILSTKKKFFFTFL